MQEEIRISQNNLLWKLFRCLVEATTVPEEIYISVKNKVCVTEEKE